MAGLGSYMIAGAVSGAAQGLVERMKALRDAAIEAQTHAQDRADKQADLETAHQYRMEEKGKTGGGGGGGSVGRKGLGGPAAAGPERLFGEYEVDGKMYGRNKAGQLKPLIGPDGQPLAAKPKKGAKADAGAPAPETTIPDTPPTVQDTAPALAGPSPLDAARAAINRGAPRDAVIQRLKDNGVDPAGL